MSDRWHCYECGATLGYCKEFSGPVCFKCAPDLTAADTPTALADAVARVIEVEADVLILLARLGLPTDYQDILVAGDPMRGIPPHILANAILSAGYRKAADVREEMARVADGIALTCELNRNARSIGPKYYRWAAAALLVRKTAAAIRAAKP